MIPEYPWGDRLPVLTGPRVVLRQMTPSDAPAVQAVFSDRETLRYTNITPHESLEDALAYVEKQRVGFRDRNYFCWGVARRTDDRIMGIVVLFHLDLKHERAELGYALGRDYHNQGFGTEALRLLLRFAFEQLNVHRLEADVDPRNGPSIRLIEKQGFQREGLLKERFLIQGERQDALLLGLLRRDWSA